LAQKELLEERIRILNFYLYGCRLGFARVDISSLPEEEVGALGIVWDEDTDPSEVETVTRSVRVDESRILNSEEEFIDWDYDYFGLLDEKKGTPELLYNEARHLENKAQLISDFEKMMGPALREGYWNPENYHDYGDLFKKSFSLVTALKPTV